MLEQWQIVTGLVVLLLIILLWYYYSSSSSSFLPYVGAGQNTGDPAKDQATMNGRMVTGRLNTGNIKTDQGIMNRFKSYVARLPGFKGKSNFVVSGGQGTGSVDADQALMSSTNNVPTMTQPVGIDNPMGTGSIPDSLANNNNVLMNAISQVQGGGQASYAAGSELTDEQSISSVPTDLSPLEANNLRTYIENVSMGSASPSNAPVVNGAPITSGTFQNINPNSNISALSGLPVALNSIYNVLTKPQSYSSDTNATIAPVNQLSASSFVGNNTSSTSNAPSSLQTATYATNNDVDSVLQRSIGKSEQAAQSDYVAQNRLLYPTQAAIDVTTITPAVKNVGILHFQVWQPAVDGQWSNPNIITDVPSMANAI
jgi:hypothetical protein